MSSSVSGTSVSLHAINIAAARAVGQVYHAKFLFPQLCYTYMQSSQLLRLITQGYLLSYLARHDYGSYFDNPRISTSTLIYTAFGASIRSSSGPGTCNISNICTDYQIYDEAEYDLHSLLRLHIMEERFRTCNTQQITIYAMERNL